MIRKVLCLSLLVAGAAIAAHAQAVPTLIKGGSIEVGGTGDYVKPDYGGHDMGGIGVVGDINLRQYYSLEAESIFTFYNGYSGQKELTFAAGPRIFYARDRWIPYVKLLAGFGHFTFPDNVEGGSTNFMYTIGGGVDWRWKRHITFRFADAQYQMWPGFGNAADYHRRAGSLTPFIISAGVKYRF